MRKILLILIVMSCALWQPLLAQESRVTGTVTDAGSGVPLPGVSIIIQGTSTGTVTDMNGTYALSAAPNATLVYSFIGYANQTVPVNNRSQINVALAEDVEQLSEVVVVGYGEQQKKLVTGAISSVKAEELKTVSTGRIEQALQGRTAGVNVLPVSGAPGAGIQIRIRGTGSNTGTNPLYVVDGMRVGDINFLDPSEIASMDILKDAASTAIYGAAAANGVVIITTKSGRKNTSEVTYNGQYGIQTIDPDIMPTMNARQYSEYLNEAGVGGIPSGETAINNAPNTNWFDELFVAAPQQQHSLQFSGGGENSTYLISGNYFDQEGVVGGDKASFKRFTFRLNSNHQVKPWLSIGENLSYININRNAIPENSEFRSVLSGTIAYDPFTPVAYTNGVPARVQDLLDAGRPLLRDPNGNVYGISEFLTGEYANPLAFLETERGGDLNNNIIGNVHADIEPLKGLKFTSRYGINAFFGRAHTWTPSYFFTTESLNLTPNANDNRYSFFQWQWENFITYQKLIGDHNINLLAGTSHIKSTVENFGANYSGLFREEDRFSYPDQAQRSGDQVYGRGPEPRTLQSFFGRVTYDYQDKYLFTATVRRDGSSVLAAGNKWQTFPSVSAGWVISNEDFYPAEVANFMNSAKLRASWGQNGNEGSVGLGAWQAAVTSSGIRYPGSDRIAGGPYWVGVAPGNLANPELRWETSEQLDFGADLAFFNNRITFTTDYYIKTTIDLISRPSRLGIAGAAIDRANVGTVENRGWEFELAYRANVAKEFQWEVAANLSTLNNEVTYLDPTLVREKGASVASGQQGTFFEEGQPIWYFRGFETNGILQTPEEVLAYNETIPEGGYDPQPGDPRIVDKNDDGLISRADFTNIGSPHPDLLYGARVNLSYKGFDFLMFMQGNQGNDVLLGFLRTDRPQANKPAFFYEDRWTGAGSTNEFFRPQTGGLVYESDMLVFDGSFTRIRQMQLGYTLPKEVLSRAGIRNARIYVSLDNYFTFTKYPGLDPEVGEGNSVGIDRGVYPTPRRAVAGLSFSF